MIKKILVVIDTSKSIKRVKELAIKIGKETSSSLTGVGVLGTKNDNAQRVDPFSGVAFQVNEDDYNQTKENE